MAFRTTGGAGKDDGSMRARWTTIRKKKKRKKGEMTKNDKAGNDDAEQGEAWRTTCNQTKIRKQ